MDYTVTGKYMQVKVPKTLPALEGESFTINFAWIDSVHDEDDTEGGCKSSVAAGAAVVMAAAAAAVALKKKKD